MMKVLATLFAVLALAASGSDNLNRPDALTVHEWGTFTTVAGPDGHPVDWLPLGGPADLPCFVNHADNNLLAKLAISKVRMETPVLYFYAPHEQNVNVKVDFPNGWVTEWYPQANSAGNRIEWNNVKIRPDATAKFPTDSRSSHYYTARETDAAPLQVMGKDEKFLFYRGVGNFPMPLSAQVLSDGHVRIGNTGSEPIPALILFENRGGKIGYRVHGSFQGQLTLDPPRLDGSFASLQQELEKTLTASGLYAREAHAMVETWRDSWFEEGTRVFYVLPKRAVDQILPLTVDPAPAHVARSFVGRMEVITPATVQAVEKAIGSNDVTTLAKYVRFLGPITGRIERKTAGIQALVDSTYRALRDELAAGCR